MKSPWQNGEAAQREKADRLLDAIIRVLVADGRTDEELGALLHDLGVRRDDVRRLRGTLYAQAVANV